MRISDWSSDVCSSDLTNAVQYAWLRLLAKGGESLMVVGDDDQSIYGWRGARIENLHQFSQDFPDAETIRLEQNYRSTACILKAANALIANNQGRLGKELWTSGCEGEPLRSQEHTSEPQSLMRTSYAVFCLKKQQQNHRN